MTPPIQEFRLPIRVLALDTATRTGWATNSPAFESGFQDFDLKRGESSGMRFLRFTQWLDSMVAICKPTHLVWEQAHHRGGAATEVGVGLSTRCLEAAARYNLEHTTIHTGTLKKWATTSGAASKQQMITAAVRFSNKIVSDDNEADAICILHWALAGFPESEGRKK